MALALLEAEGRMHRLAGFRHLPALQEALRETFREESPPRGKPSESTFANRRVRRTNDITWPELLLFTFQL